MLLSVNTSVIVPLRIMGHSVRSILLDLIVRLSSVKMVVHVRQLNLNASAFLGTLAYTVRLLLTSVRGNLATMEALAIAYSHFQDLVVLVMIVVSLGHFVMKTLMSVLQLYLLAKIMELAGTLLALMNVSALWDMMETHVKIVSLDVTAGHVGMALHAQVMLHRTRVIARLVIQALTVKMPSFLVLANLALTVAHVYLLQMDLLLVFVLLVLLVPDVTVQSAMLVIQVLVTMVVLVSRCPTMHTHVNAWLHLQVLDVTVLSAMLATLALVTMVVLVCQCPTMHIRVNAWLISLVPDVTVLSAMLVILILVTMVVLVSQCPIMRIRVNACLILQVPDVTVLSSMLVILILVKTMLLVSYLQ